MITWDNYEEYLMMHADGELSPEEERKLMAFVKKHPKLRKELAAYEHTRLTPDTAQVFADKSSLLKTVPEQRTIALPQWRKYSIAAGIAALVFVSVFKLTAPHRNGTVIVKTDTVAPHTPVVPANRQPEYLAPQMAKNTAPQIPVKLNVQQPAKKRMVDGHASGIAVASASKKNRKQNDLAPVHPAKQLEIAMQDATPAQLKTLPQDTDQAVEPKVKDVPSYTVEDKNESAGKSFWDRLPIDDIKKKQLEHMAGSVADAYKEVNTAKLVLNERNVSVKIAKRKLIISF